jgi:hypothetical protein
MAEAVATVVGVGVVMAEAEAGTPWGEPRI